eukprot:CAMPEP_0195632816 /NCGR_PEP_ID=MMETSP0815-20121206/21800_1 /TAXON_ID=97485 /ORGANISM="Prymnesium parvum, Strain Texoma1" /LENGTH=116 /DNA_ID=CAMNT_0040774409 /DNA_START=361 /DNA_END=708 /DNA_ORIENTATION=-
MRKSCELMSSRSCSPSSTCETGCALLCEAERYLATPTRAAITRRRAMQLRHAAGRRVIRPERRRGVVAGGAELREEGEEEREEREGRKEREEMEARGVREATGGKGGEGETDGESS